MDKQSLKFIPVNCDYSRGTSGRPRNLQGELTQDSYYIRVYSLNIRVLYYRNEFQTLRTSNGNDIEYQAEKCIQIWAKIDCCKKTISTAWDKIDNEIIQITISSSVDSIINHIYHTYKLKEEKQNRNQ